ncbi:MAG: hypothetical protein H6607_08895 [Flavobacteriales bacterium]|nr:hypothetical protein [Flavobacteriales bacterium]
MNLVKPKLLVFFTLILIGVSCKFISKKKEVEKPPVKTISLTLKAENLSEDLSFLSTKNDEVIWFVYSSIDSNTLGNRLFVDSLVFDDSTRSKTYLFDADSLKGKKLTFFVYEIDFETPIYKLDTITQNHYKDLIEVFKQNDYSKLREFLGSEDMLGYHVLTNLTPEQSHTFEISGIHKADKYKYLFEVLPVEKP